MPPEGAKWVKNPQNRKKTKKAPMAPGKKIIKNQQSKKTGNPERLLFGRGPSITG